MRTAACASLLTNPTPTSLAPSIGFVSLVDVGTATVTRVPLALPERIRTVQPKGFLHLQQGFVVLARIRQHRQVQSHRHQSLASLIVQLAANALPFILLGAEQVA